jgi:hypothetical protein
MAGETGNLIGGPYKEYVNNQIIVRQKLHGKANRSTRELQYLNSRNAWVKLASGTSMSQQRLDLLKDNPLVSGTLPGKDLAINNVLFNGLTAVGDVTGTPENKTTSISQKHRAGITGVNRAYGVGGTSQYGYSPMPGITDMTLKCLNRGSIKKASIKLKAHNKNQFDVIDVLYLRLGYTVLLEWGFDKYVNNQGTISDQYTTLTEDWFFKDQQDKSDYREAFKKINKYRDKTNGNYDAAFGVISNFSWTFEDDGSYSIDMEVMSLGDILESLKVDLPSLLFDKSGAYAERYAALLEEKGGDTVGEEKFYSVLYDGLKPCLDFLWDNIVNWTGNGQISPPETVDPGEEFSYNNTGRDDVSNKQKGIYLSQENKTYGTEWNYGNIKNVQILTPAGLPYTASAAIFDKSFDWDAKLDGGTTKTELVLKGLYKVFYAGEITSDNDYESTEEMVTSPFGDNFSKNLNSVARNFSGEQEPKSTDLNSIQSNINEAANTLDETVVSASVLLDSDGDGELSTGELLQGSIVTGLGLYARYAANVVDFLTEDIPNKEVTYFFPSPRFETSDPSTDELKEKYDYFLATSNTTGVNLLQQYVPGSFNGKNPADLDNFGKITVMTTAIDRYKQNRLENLDTDLEEVLKELVNKGRKQVFLKYYVFSTPDSAEKGPIYNDAREIWASEYEDLNDSQKWKFILNNVGTDSEGNTINVSERLGITKERFYTKVYEAFKEKGIADAVPNTSEESKKLDALEDSLEGQEEEGVEITEDQKQEKARLEKIVERQEKDYITKDRNRIYRFFYDKRFTRIDDEDVANADNFGDVSMIPGEILGEIKETKNGNVDIIRLKIEPLDFQWYIRLGDFLNFLNNDLLAKIDGAKEGGTPIISVTNDIKTNICYVIDNVYSLDPQRIIVNNDYFVEGLSNPDDSSTAVKSPIFSELNKYVVTSGENKWGQINNIYFNFNRLEQIFDSTLVSNKVSLYEALKEISNDINECLGNINNIEPVISEENVVFFIDQTTIPNIKDIANELGIPTMPEKEEAILEVFGINKSGTGTNTSNFVRSINLQTKISKGYATMITIGATSNGSIPGTEATAFSRWNFGIEDRFKNNIFDAKGQKNNDIVNKKILEKYALMITDPEKGSKFGFNSLVGETRVISTSNIKYNSNVAEDMYKLMQSENSKELDDFGVPLNPIESSIGFLPFNLSLTMDGISGFVIYNKLKINQKFLPSNYPETLEFVITQINHKLSNNDWVTDLETIAIAKSVITK